MNNPNENHQNEYLNQKRDRTKQGQLTQQQRLEKQLKNLPKGENLFDWVCKHLGKQLGFSVMWQYADSNETQQSRSNRIHIINGEKHQIIQTIEINRQEIAQVRSTGESWIGQLLAAIKSEEGQQHASQMHKKFEDDLSNRYEEMMEKLTGNNE